MVKNKIHDDADITFPGFLYKPFHVIHCAVCRIDIVIISYIVAVISLRGYIARGEPYRSYAKLLKMIEL